LVLLAAGVCGAASGGGSFAERVQRICAEEPAKVTSAFCSMEAGVVELVKADGSRIAIDVLVAATELQRTAGYQFIDGGVVQETAILFVFDAPVSRSFHMCNVLVGLDIVWFRANGTILDATTMRPGQVMDPIFCRNVYSPRRFGTYQFALELPEGAIERLGLSSLNEWRLEVAPWR